jgi:hypothetical protein
MAIDSPPSLLAVSLAIGRTPVSVPVYRPRLTSMTYDRTTSDALRVLRTERCAPTPGAL